MVCASDPAKTANIPQDLTVKARVSGSDPIGYPQDISNSKALSGNGIIRLTVSFKAHCGCNKSPLGCISEVTVTLGGGGEGGSQSASFQE